MGLEDRVNVKVGTLSGGQRQALALVMTTIVVPDVLLLTSTPPPSTQSAPRPSCA